MSNYYRHLIGGDSRIFQPRLQNAVAHYLYDELSGNLIDKINTNDGVLNGTINRDGSRYEFTEPSSVIIPSNNDFNIEDGINNIEFVISFEFEFNNIQNQESLAERLDDFFTYTKVNYRILYANGRFTGQFFHSNSNADTSNNYNIVPTTNPYNINIGTKYRVTVTYKDQYLKLAVNGVVQNQVFVDKLFNTNSTADVRIANQPLISNTQFEGKMYETLFIKGRGWTNEEIQFYDTP